MPYVLEQLKPKAFIAGKVELYNELCSNPSLRMVDIKKLETIKQQLRDLGHDFRIRYRGPHLPLNDTIKANARAFTVYMYSWEYV